MRYLRTCIVCALLLAGGTARSAAQTLTLTGRIADRADGRPLAGATVAVRGSAQGTAADAEGRYALRGLPAGRITLAVSYVGYRTEERTFVLGSDTRRQDFALEEERRAIDDVTVVTTGTGTAHYIGSAPVQTEVLTGEALRSYSGRSLDDLLAGLSPSFDFAQSDMGSGMTLNGLGNSYILVLVDGRRMHGDTGGQNDLGRIDPAEIERIEIVKGASSSLYGSDAIAGVVNIVTRKHRDIPFGVENTTRIGSHLDIRQHNAVEFKAGRLSSRTTFTAQHTDGWQNTRKELYRDSLYTQSTTQTVSRYTNARAEEELRLALGRWELYAAGMFYYKKLYHTPGAPRWRSFDLFYRDQSYRAGAKFAPSGRTTLSFDLSFDRHAYYYAYYNNYIDEYSRIEKLWNGELIRVPIHTVYYPGDHSLESDQRRWLAQFKGVFDLGSKNRFTAGAEWQRDALVAPHRMLRDSESAYTLSAYVQDEWDPAPSFNLTGGVRLVGHKEFGVTATPKLSALWKLGPVNLRATYANGFKTPTIKELYYFYERTVMSKVRLYIGNEALRPQRSHYYSGGAEWRSRFVTASATGYYNRVRDMIAQVAVPIPPGFAGDEGSDLDGAMQYVNMERAEIKGIDLLVTLRPGGGVTLGGGYSYVDARGDVVDEEASEEAGHTVVERRILDGTAFHRGNVNVSWKLDRPGYGLTVNLFGKIQSKRHYKEYGDAPGFSIWRLTTTHRLVDRKRWRLEAALGVDNLFDYVERHPYGVNYGSTTPGRTLFGSATLRFGSDTPAQAPRRHRAHTR